jgi:hypothetical protein
LSLQKSTVNTFKVKFNKVTNVLLYADTSLHKKNLMTDIIELDYFFKRHLLENVIHSILKFHLVLTYCVLNFMELIQLVAAFNLHI